MTGILDNETIERSRNTRPRPPETVAERQADEADLAARIAAGNQAILAKEQAALASDLEWWAYAKMAEKYASFAKPGKASATKAVYVARLKHWHAWCVEHGVSSMPALPGVLAYYLDEELEAGAGVTTLKQIVAAISHAHELRCMWSPCTDPLVSAVIAAAKPKVTNGNGHDNKETSNDQENHPR